MKYANILLSLTLAEKETATVTASVVIDTAFIVFRNLGPGYDLKLPTSSDFFYCIWALITFAVEAP